MSTPFSTPFDCSSAFNSCISCNKQALEGERREVRGGSTSGGQSLYASLTARRRAFLLTCQHTQVKKQSKAANTFFFFVAFLAVGVFFGSGCFFVVFGSGCFTYAGLIVSPKYSARASKTRSIDRGEHGFAKSASIEDAAHRESVTTRRKRGSDCSW